MKQQAEDQLRRYEEYLRHDPKNIKLLIEIARLYNQLTRFEEALSTVQLAEQHAPGDPVLAFTKSSIFLASNQPELAIQVLTNLRGRGIDNSAIRYNLAFAHALQGQMSEAEALLASYDTITADRPETAILLAKVKHHLGDLDGTINLTETFLRHHPEHPQSDEAEGILALAALDNEDRGTAERYAKRALNHNKNNAEAQITLGSLALEAFNIEKADQYFANVLQRNPNSGRAWLGKGLVEMLRRNLNASEDALVKAIKCMPNHLGTWNTLAWCQIAAAKIDEAEQTLQQAMEVDRNFSETHGGLAIVAALRGQTEVAEEHLKRALRLNPLSLSGQFAKSLMDRARGDSQQADDLILNLMQTPMGKDKRTLDQALQRLAAKNQRNDTTH